MKPTHFHRWIALALLAVSTLSATCGAEDDTKPATPKADPAGEAAIDGARRGPRRLIVKRKGSDERVQVGQSVTVATNETAETVVVVFGDATIDGSVSEDVVVVGGSARINGKVGENVVSVLGRIELGPNSEVGGDVVGVGKGIERAEGAKVGGQLVPVDLGQLGELKLPPGARSFFRYCVLELRPLSFRVGWVWWVWGVFLLGYLLVTVVFPRPVDAGVATLEEKPALSLLLGLLAKPLLGIIALLLAVTGIGVIVVPFLFAGLMLAAFIGKAAVMRYLGHQFGRQLHAEQLQRPVVALLAGAAMLTLFYLIPFVGFAAWAVASMWGMGAILMALGSRFRRETPATAQPAPSIASGWAAPLAATAAPATTETATNVTTTPGGTLGFSSTVGLTPAAQPPPASTGTPPSADTTAAPPVSSPSAAVPTAPEAWSLPRVGFWRRALATLLDSILLGVLTGAMRIMPVGFILWVAYYAAMWAWRGTTVGGIVVGIKVVRLDGRKMDFATALVRAFGAVFSTIVFGLGYFWAGWDRDKQAWHDKIAGTVVVRVPQGQSLVMF